MPLRRRFAPARAGLALVLLTLVGCASGPDLPKYEEPKLEASKLASIKGEWATYVTEVDGHGVPFSGMQSTNGTGGNAVKVLPGKRTIVLQRRNGGIKLHPTTYTITYEFEAGHEYEVMPNNAMSMNPAIFLRDKTTGKTRYTREVQR